MVSKLPPFLRANSCSLRMEGIRSWNNSGSGRWYLITGWLMMTLGGNKFHLWLRFDVLSWPSMSREEQTNFEYFWKLGRMPFFCWLLYWLLDIFIYVYHFIHVYIIIIIFHMNYVCFYCSNMVKYVWRLSRFQGCSKRCFYFFFGMFNPTWRMFPFWLTALRPRHDGVTWRNMVSHDVTWYFWRSYQCMSIHQRMRREPKVRN